MTKVARTIDLRPGRRIRVNEPVAVGALSVGGGFHPSVLEESGEDVPLFGAFPVQRGLRDQKVEQRVISCGHGAPEAGLPGFPALAIGKMFRLLQQIFRERHPSCPGRIFNRCLFRLTTEIEVSVEADFVRPGLVREAH